MTKSDKPILLVVEDNAAEQKLFTLLCEQFGYSVVVVGSGKGALEYFTSDLVKFSAVLMDWKMPDMDGLECAKMIRLYEESAAKPRMPIIAVTARAGEDDRRQCLDAGMDDYLSKPFSADDFRRMLLRWAYTGEPNLKLLPPD